MDEINSTFVPLEEGVLLHDYFWVIMVVTVLLLVLMALGIAVGVFKFRNRHRYDYTILREEEDLPMKLELQRRQHQDDLRDAALLRCSFYLRSSGVYSLTDHMADMGSRLNKSWFLVRDDHGKANKLMTMSPRPRTMPIPFNTATKNTLLQLVSLLRHPCVFPVLDLDFSQEQEQIVTVYPYTSEGSLKDVIYKSSCRDAWCNKYSMKSRVLPLDQIQQYGRQILQGLLYLSEQGFPAMNHLHTGNILIQSGFCRLSGYENSLLGLSSRVMPLISRFLEDEPQAVETVCFGHVLFEMAAGYELSSPKPLPSHMINIPYADVATCLEYIFENPSGFPPIEEVSKLYFFREAKVQYSSLYTVSVLKLPSTVKSLLKAAKRNQNITTNLKKHKSNRDVTIENKRPNERVVLQIEKEDKQTSLKGKRRKTKKPKPETELRPPLPPPPPPPPADSAPMPSQAAMKGEDANTQNSEQQRSRVTLLSDIRKGVQLKTTHNASH